MMYVIFAKKIVASVKVQLSVRNAFKDFICIVIQRKERKQNAWESQIIGSLLLILMVGVLKISPFGPILQHALYNITTFKKWPTKQSITTKMNMFPGMSAQKDAFP